MKEFDTPKSNTTSAPVAKSKGNEPLGASENESAFCGSGSMTFSGLTSTDFKHFRWIPEDPSSETDTREVTGNETYYGDGLYFSAFTDSKYWYKVSAGGSVSVTKYKSNQFIFDGEESSFCRGIAELWGTYYNVGWEPKSNSHWTKNPFDK